MKIILKFIFIILFFVSNLSFAATKTWDGGGADNNWTTAANWDANVAPSAGDALVFSGSTRLTPNNDFTAGTSFASITFASGCGAFTLSGNAITITGGAITNNNSTGQMEALNLSITYTTVAPTITNVSGGDLRNWANCNNGAFTVTISGGGGYDWWGTWTGTGGFIYSGTGWISLYMSGTFTGDFSVTGTGLVSFNSAGCLGNARLVLSNGTEIDNSSGGDITLTTNNSQVWNGNFTFRGSYNLNMGAGAIDIGSSTRTVTCTANNLTLGGVISGTGAITKSGAGTLILSGSSTYSGLTTVSAGTLKLGANGGVTNTPLGTTAAGTTVSSGATLDLAGFSLGTTEALSLNGTGVSGTSGALMNSGGAATYSGLVTLTGSATIKGGSGTIAISNAGTISGATFGLTLGGAQGGSIASIIGTTSGSLTKSDAGTWTLSGANTYTGTTIISAGTLKLGASGVIPDASAVTVTGTLDMNTFSETVGSIAGAGTIDNVSGAGTPTLSCNGDNTNTTFSGIIQNTTGTLALTKSGAGNLILSGTNTFTGITTINNGNLVADNANALGSITGGTVVNSGGTLVLYSYAFVAEPLTIYGTGSSNTYNGALRIGNSITTSITFPGAITLGSNSRIGVYDASATLVLSGVISGGFTLDKYDSGTLTLSGTNTYTGLTTIADGTLKLNNTAALGTNAAGTSITSGAVLDLNGITYSTSEALTVNGTGISSGGAVKNSSSTAATYAGLLTLGSASSIIATSGDITISNTGTITGATFGLTLGGAYNGSLASILGTGTGTLTKQDAGTWTLTAINTATGTTTISGGILTLGGADGNVGGNITNNATLNLAQTAPISLISVSAVISGTGAITSTAVNGGLSGNNTYTGLTTINSGKLSMLHNNALGGTGTGTVLNGSSALIVYGSTYTYAAEPLTINNTAVLRTGSNSTTDIGTYTGAITLNCNVTFSAIEATDILTVSGVISGSYNVLTAGSGIVIFSGANTYTGTTTVSAGTLKLGASGVIPDASAVTVTGTLDMNTYSETVGSIAGAGTIDNVSGAGTPTLTCGGDGTSTVFSGTITDVTGTLSLTKSGAGALTLSGANTYSGTTSLSVGSLNINNASALGTGTFTIANGTTIDNTTAGSITNTNNNAQTWNGDFTFTGTSSLNLGTGAVAMGASARAVTVSASTLTVGGTISGTGGLTKSGNGTMALGSVNASNWTGTTTVNAGTLQLGDPGSDNYKSTSWIINSGGTLKCMANDVVINTAVLTINSGGTLNMNNFGDSYGTISGAGSITLGSATIVLTLGSSTTFSGVMSGTGNLDVEGSNGGTLTLSGLNTYTGWTRVRSSTLSINTIGSVNGGSSAIGNPSSAANGTIQMGYLTSTGTLVYTGSAQTTDRVINLNGTTGGAIINQSGTGLLKFSSANTATGSGAKTLTLQGSSAGTGEIDGAIVDGATSTVTSIVKSGTGTWTLSGTNTYTGTTTVSAGILKLNNIAALGTNAAGTTVSSGAALDLNGIAYVTTEALTISGTGVSSGGALINTGASASYAGTVTMAANTTINTANQITLSGTISPSTYSVTKAGTNSLVFTSNTATVNNLDISAGTLSAGSSTINIYGNFTNSGTFTCGIGTVAFKGTTAQSIAAATFNNLTIDNSTSPASSAATLAGNITVGGALTMTTGILNTSSNIITLGSTATISETNPSATNPSSYVIGYVSTTRDLVQNVTNTFGGIGVSLTETTQASNSTVITRRTGTASVGVGNQSILRYFDITPTVDASLNGTLVFSYIDAELNGQNEVNFKLYKSSNSGSTWAKQASSSVSTGSNTLSLSGITSFSRWTASNTSTNPLPVEIISFIAVKGTDATVLKWETAQEINNDYFDIERSHDGITFEKITIIKGVGTTNSISNYSYLDKSTNQTLATYYRLKQVDFDKKTEYSNIVFVNGETNHKELNLFPNPLEEGNPLYACLGDNDEGIIKVSVFDLSGKLIHDFLIDNVVVNSNIIIENENLLLKKGMYIIEIKSIHNDYKQKLEVK